MKTLQVFLTLLLFFLSFSNSLVAQNDELDREIRIAERILEEIFSDISEPNRNYPFSSQNSVSGEYIPGIGVHFSVGENYYSRFANMSGNIRFKENDGPERSFTFNREDSGERVQDNVIGERINEYLTGYATQIRGIGDDEEVRVTFGLNTNTNRWISALQVTAGDSISDKNSAISKWISGRDIRRAREGDLSENGLLQQIKTVKISENKLPRDISIFASILETALADTKLEGLRVNKSVKSNYIPGWGVRYYITVNSRGSGFFGFVSDLDHDKLGTEIDSDVSFEIDMEEFETEREKIKHTIDSLDISSEFSEKMDSLAVAIPRLMDSLKVAVPKVMEEIKTIFATDSSSVDEDVLIADREILENEISEIAGSYGNTLSSLKDDEVLMIQIDWRIRNNIIPDRTLYYISKADLMKSMDLKIAEI